MRHLPIACVLLAACEPMAAAYDPADKADTYKYTDVAWDFRPVEWSDNPVIVVVRSRTLYPAAPDVVISLACRGDGSVDVGGDIAHIVQDAGYIEPPTRMGLTSGLQRVDAPTAWTPEGYGVTTDLVLQPGTGQFRKILTSGPVYITYTGDNWGTAELPVPSKPVVEAFLQACRL